MTQIADKLEDDFDKVLDDIDPNIVSKKVAEFQKAFRQQIADNPTLHFNDLPLRFPYP